LRGCEDPARLIGTMTGRHHAISEFLADNVLDTLEPSMLDFLLATSITERICGDLASALAGVPGGQQMLERVEERDLFLRRIDEQWFRYHQLFLEFLRHRLAREVPERVAELHRIASRWFAEHRLVSEAVDHALAAGDEKRAMEIVEKDGISLVANSQMGTLIALVGKLPAAAVQSRPRLQLALAWANIVLHRIPAAEQALALVDSTLETSGLSSDETANVRADAGVVRGVVALRSDRLAGIDEHIAPCLARRDRMRPFAVASAANVATFAAAYRYDLDEVNRVQAWAAPFYERSGDAFSVVNGLCFTGLAHHLMLDNAAAENYFRRALKIAKRSGGSHSYTARLASSLLGELLYERGDLDEAERLLDEGYKLGPEGGSVDFKIARYVISARIKALQGDRRAAAQRLNEATRVARALSLNRLRALAEHERIRLRLPPHPEFGVPTTSYRARRQPVGAGVGRSASRGEPPPGVVAGSAAVGRVSRCRRTSRRREDDARGRRGTMRAVANVALPRRRWSTRGRHPLGTTRRPAGRAMALGMARSARRFPRSNAQCRSCAAGLTDAGSTRTGTPVNRAMPASRSRSSGALDISRFTFAPPAVFASRRCPCGPSRAGRRSHRQRCPW
jgi:serine/threonine-protein kinase PknK